MSVLQKKHIQTEFGEQIDWLPAKSNPAKFHDKCAVSYDGAVKADCYNMPARCAQELCDALQLGGKQYFGVDAVIGAERV